MFPEPSRAWGSTQLSPSPGEEMASGSPITCPKASSQEVAEPDLDPKFVCLPSTLVTHPLARCHHFLIFQGPHPGNWGASCLLRWPLDDRVTLSTVLPDPRREQQVGVITSGGREATPVFPRPEQSAINLPDLALETHWSMSLLHPAPSSPLW